MMGAAGASGDKVYVDDVFSTYVYEGSGTNQTINNGIDLSGEGGLVWIKRTDSPDANNVLFDTVRGVDKVLFSDLTLGSTDFANSLTAFSSSGFSLGSNSTGNASGLSNVAWTFRKAPGFFDVVTYTGDGNATKTLNHSLGSVPGMIMVKNTNDSGNWITYHRSAGANKWLLLNTTDGAQNNYGIWPWNNTTPTSTQFTVALEGTGITSDTYRLNVDNDTYVAYIFAHDSQVFGTDEDESIIKCGSFTTNSSGTLDAPVDLGFEPQFIIFKAGSGITGGAAGTGNWFILDMVRAFGGPSSKSRTLKAQTDGAEQERSAGWLIRTSTGFDVDVFAFFNANKEIPYMAIRRPNKPPEAATEVFDDVIYNGTAGAHDVANSLLYTDLTWIKRRTASDPPVLIDRLRGDTKYLKSSANDVEATWDANDVLHLDRMYSVGFQGNVTGFNNSSGQPYISWNFKRASGFFDIVGYSGNATAGTSHNHNLNAIPEFIICKSYIAGGGAGFWCYHKDLSTNNAIRMDGSSNGNVAEQSASNYWNSSTHSATTFTLGDYGDINGSGKTFVGYLFATLPGISKVGSYSGTGNAVDVDCGFAAGAKFVMIKRKDGAGDWYVWDSARGIISGNDPYLLLNNAQDEVTNTDYIDPLTSGFTVTSSSPDALNVNGGDYIFLAIA